MIVREPFGDTGADALTVVQGVGTGAAQGAAVGSVAGPWGTLIGGLVGAIGGGTVSGVQVANTDQAQNQAAQNAAIEANLAASGHGPVLNPMVAPNYVAPVSYTPYLIALAVLLAIAL